MSHLPLEGVRVLEFSFWIAVPHATLQLAQMGADVIKVETHDHTDPSRGGAGNTNIERGTSYHAENGSKKNITLNIQRPEGKALIRQLVSLSDIVIENFAAGVIDRLGFGYEDLRKINPSIIMYSSSGLGKNGPYAHYVAYGVSLMPFSGFSSLTGYDDGYPGRSEPFHTDYVAPGHASLAMLMALYHRERTGEGQYIELSMTEAQLSQLPEAALDYLWNKRVHGPRGNHHEFWAPHGTYPCRGDDAWVSIACRNDHDWEKLIAAMGHPAWAGDPTYADLRSRYQHQGALDRSIAEWTRQHTPQEVTALLQGLGVPSGPTLNNIQIARDPHLQARNVFARTEHPEMGWREMPGLPWKLSSAPEPNYQAPALMGQHNFEVMCELLGMPVDEFARLVGDGVIV